MERRDFLGGAAKLALAAVASRWVAPARTSDSQTVTLAAVGDCLITRGFVRSDPGLQPLLSILRSADVAFGNFEMTLPDPDMYPAATGACGDLNNSSEGPMPEELQWAGFKMMSLANNHSLDYGPAGMLATLKKVAAAGIAHAGTGRNLEDARAPAYYDSPAGRVALVACASTIRLGSYASSGNGEIPGRPGVSPLRVRTTYRVEGAQIEALRKIQGDLFPGGRRSLVEPARSEGLNFLDNQFVAGSPPDVMTSPDPRDLAEIVASVRRARRNADCVLVSIHAHEGHRNREDPATFLREFAHACVDAGASAFVGHGPHVLRGIEIYKGRPIFYSLGNFIFAAEGMRQIPKEIFETCGISGNDPSDFFDKAMHGFADAAYWESVVAQVGFERGELREIKLYPTVLQQELPRAERGMPVRANAAQSRTILGRLVKLSEPFGTKLEQAGDVGIVRI
jgi:poly-gamma-glutamate capsule biosynthesis protein CapA/YwtB (metallophosphatase superfamily)